MVIKMKDITQKKLYFLNWLLDQFKKLISIQMNSSTGFKKRTLLRPASGLISNNRQFLKTIDISQSQPIIASNIRTQVAAIQEQINLLDKDKTIRAGQSSLEKSYVLNIRKWMREAQSMSEKEDDDGKVLKHMGVDTYEAGFRKLWKVLANIDLMVSKVTELQAVQFLKYDKHFQNIAEHSANGERILQAIGKTGFNPSNFYLSQLLLERELELFEATSALKRQNSNSANSSKGFAKVKGDSDELIQQLRKQNNKLMELMEELQQNQKRQLQMQKQKREREMKEKESQKKITSHSSIPSGDPRDAFSQIEEKYKEQIHDLNEKIHKLNEQLGEIKIHCNLTEAKLKAAQNQLKNGEFKSTERPKAGSYEQALLQEMNKMKSGFERKIKVILDEFAGKQRQMRRKQYEYKTQNDRIKWEKGLLMKKYDLLSSA